MNINSLEEKFTIDKWKALNCPFIKTFVDCKLNNNDQFSHFELFKNYVFRWRYIHDVAIPNRVEQWYGPEEKNNIFRKKNKLDLRNEIVKDILPEFYEVYIGLSIYKKKFVPIFLHLDHNENDNEYYIVGYHRLVSESEIDICSDYKCFGYIDNLPIILIENYDKEMIYDLKRFSEETINN